MSSLLQLGQGMSSTTSRSPASPNCLLSPAIKAVDHGKDLDVNIFVSVLEWLRRVIAPKGRWGGRNGRSWQFVRKWAAEGLRT
jgi:hypothetical protein